MLNNSIEFFNTPKFTASSLIFLLEYFFEFQCDDSWKREIRLREKETSRNFYTAIEFADSTGELPTLSFIEGKKPVISNVDVALWRKNDKNELYLVLVFTLKK